MIRFPQWGWALLNGAITMLVGIIIYRQLPIDALWVVGLLVGVEMLFQRLDVDHALNRNSLSSQGAGSMKITPDEWITWLIVGALAGSLAGMVVKRRKEGFGPLLNLGIGLVGALMGGFLFKVLDIRLGLLGEIKVTSQQVVAGFLGSLIFLAVIWGARLAWARGRKAASTVPPPKPE